jgi:glycolate oxidase FAD binding subunit
VRDFTLGVRILDGRGQDLAFGGRVMKNVAGYDASRLMVGALGTLGVLLDISLKVLPRPVHELTLRFDADQAEAIRCCNLWAGQPYPISATCHENGRLSLRLSGSEPGVEAAARRLGGERIADGEHYWCALREQRLDFFVGEGALWRVAVRSNTDPLSVPGRQLLEWNAALRWLRTDADVAQVRDAARAGGGHAICFRGASDAAHVFHPLAQPLLLLHRRLKQVFDPAGILNRGRLYAEL